MKAMIARFLCGSVLVATAGIVGAAPASAADPNVPCPTNTDEGGDDLQTAVRFADDNPGTTIELAPGCTYTLRQSGTESFLPITRSMTIHGNGAKVLRPVDTEHFLLFDVDAAATLTMSDVTLSSATDLHAHLLPVLWVKTDGQASLSHVTFDHGGPGIYSDGRLTVVDSTFVGINARNTFGGAIDNDAHGTLDVERTDFTGNHVNGPLGEKQAGGALYNSGQAFVGESTFTGNSAFVGGAISNQSSLDVRDSTFDRNAATLDGGAIDQSGGPSLFLRDTFTGNNVERAGGAINAFGGNMVIDETTFSGNRAVKPQFTTLVSQGGAIHSALPISLENDTFADNVAEQGSAIYHDDSTNNLSMSGTVLSGAGDLCAGTAARIVDVGYNLASSTSSACPATFAVGDPLLGSLGNHGGLTKTMLPLAGSPLLDALALDVCPTRDQRNFVRPAGPLCDIGAVEDQLPTAPGTVTLSTGTNPNRGSFGLHWTAATDPEGPVTYRLYRQDADDAVPALVGTTSSTSKTFTAGAPEQEGTLRYWAESVDSAGYTSRSAIASAAIVSDRSAPIGLLASADRAADYDGAGSDDWYADTVTVSFSGATDQALPDGSAGSGVADTPPSTTYNTSGPHTATGTATDAAGNVSDTASLTVQVDADNPTASFTSCPSTVLLHAVTSAGWSASDASSGLQSAASGSVALNTVTVGPHQVQSPTPRDHVAHAGVPATCAYTVIYDFAGFLGLPTYPASTAVKAKDGVSLRFTLAGDQGLAVLATGSPTSLPVNCSTGAALGPATATATNKKGLTYNGSTRTYSYEWTPDPAWAKTCRQLVVGLNDGTVHRANVTFK